MSSHPSIRSSLPNQRLAGATILALLLNGVLLPGTLPTASTTTGIVQSNAAESAPIAGPNNPHSWSYSFTTRWDLTEQRTQYLGITMPTSVNGMLNVVQIDTEASRRGATDTSKNLVAREIFNDGLERSGQASITMHESGRVLIGTTRGELVDVDPDNLTTTKVSLPPGSASMVNGLSESGPEVIVSTRSANFGQAGNQGNGEVLGLNYACIYTQCASDEFWTRYGAPAPGNAIAYEAGRWGGALIAASGDQRAVLSVYQNGEWRELMGVPATAANSRERFVQAKIIGNYLYASYDGSNQSQNGTQVYRLGKDAEGRITLTRINVINRWVISPMSKDSGYSESSVIYRGFSDSLMIYDPETGAQGTTTKFGDFTSAQMPERTRTGSLPTSSCWVVPDAVCSTWRPDGSISLAFKATPGRPETLKRIATTSAANQTIVDAGRRQIGRLAVGPEKTKVYASSSFFGHSLRQIDAATAQTKDLALRSNLDPDDSVTQVESLGVVGDQLLMGTYAQGVIAQLDPTSPISCENAIDRNVEECNPSFTVPKRIIGDNQVRPVSIADLGNGQAAIASYGRSGQLTGALTLYDTTARTITSRNLLKDASGIALSEMGLATVASRDLAATGGWIYAGTNARPPDNRSTQTRAAIIRYNVYSQETQALPAPYSVVNDLKFGADGRLYAMAGFYFVTIDPGLNGQSFRVVNVTAIGTKRGYLGALTPLADGTFAALSGAQEQGGDGELHLVKPRSDGPPTNVSLGRLASGPLAVVDNPAGSGSRWFYSRGASIYYQDQPGTAGTLG